MKNLRGWQQEHPKDFASEFHTLLFRKKSDLTGNPELVDQLDSDRRRVSQLFGKVRSFSNLGVINKRDVGATWGSGTYTFMSDVLMPLERAKSDALFDAKSVTPAEKREADVESEETLKYWDDVLRKRSSER